MNIPLVCRFPTFFTHPWKNVHNDGVNTYLIHFQKRPHQQKPQQYSLCPQFGTVRTVEISEPWFVGKDVAEALEYKIK